MSYKKIHQIRIDFNVTEKIRRYVFVYIIEAEDCYMIDSGVYGCEKQIASYMESIGRKLSDIKEIFLTHAHPDHIGSAAWFRENVGCEIYAGREERRWIEDIDLQFSERPIPNFYILAGRSTKVDHVLHDGDEVLLEEGLSIHAYRTAGHSAGEMSYRLEDAFFIGDTVPVITDIPIIMDVPEMIASIKILRRQEGIRSFYPAWDHSYSAEEMKEKLEEAGTYHEFGKSDCGIGCGTGPERSDQAGLGENGDADVLGKPAVCPNGWRVQKGMEMSCYFVIDTYIDPDKGRREYDEYIELVKPIVEAHNGEYLVRSEKIIPLSEARNPQRIIIIRFPSKKELFDCFSSQEYRNIQEKRISSVDARAVIVEE